MTIFSKFSRAFRVFQAREFGEEEAARVEAEVVNEIVGPGTVGSEERPLPLVEKVGVALEQSQVKIALATGKKPPTPATYDPLFSTEQTFKEVWELRQVIDHLGIPYEFYLDAAADYFMGVGKQRMPRVSQYSKNPVIGYVLRRWTQARISA